jgi:hypothetical protein
MVFINQINNPACGRQALNINLLSKCKDVGKQHDGAEIQHGNYSCQGCLLSNLTNVKVFHLMEFKG